nr:MAG TPA: hypothetical protein [Bacteriophage sp.]
MNDLYRLFVYSGFKHLPDEIIKKPQKVQEVIFAFLHKAMEEKDLPIQLNNFKLEDR